MNWTLKMFLIVVLFLIGFTASRYGISNVTVNKEWNNYCERVHGLEWDYTKDKYFSHSCYKPNFETKEIEVIYFTFEEFQKVCPKPKFWEITNFRGGWLHECE